MSNEPFLASRESSSVNGFQTFASDENIHTKDKIIEDTNWTVSLASLNHLLI